MTDVPPRSATPEPRTEAGRRLLKALSNVRVSGHNMRQDILAIEAEARSVPQSEREGLDRIRAEIQANRKQGVSWDPPVDPKIERWYSEGYDRGLRDADSIVAALASPAHPDNDAPPESAE